MALKEMLIYSELFVADDILLSKSRVVFISNMRHLAGSKISKFRSFEVESVNCKLSVTS